MWAIAVQDNGGQVAGHAGEKAPPETCAMIIQVMQSLEQADQGLDAVAYLAQEDAFASVLGGRQPPGRGAMARTPLWTKVVRQMGEA